MLRSAVRWSAFLPAARRIVRGRRSRPSSRRRWRGGTSVGTVPWVGIVIYYIPELDGGSGTDRVVRRAARGERARNASGRTACGRRAVVAQARGAAPAVTGRRLVAAWPARR